MPSKQRASIIYGVSALFSAPHFSRPVSSLPIVCIGPKPPKRACVVASTSRGMRSAKSPSAMISAEMSPGQSAGGTKGGAMRCSNSATQSKPLYLRS